MTYYRWSDNDKRWGPFIWNSKSDYNPIAIELTAHPAEYDGEKDYCTLRFSAFGCHLIAILPSIVKPFREKVKASFWSDDDINRLGRNWYWNTEKSEYGFSYSNGFLTIHYGRQSMSSDTEKSWSWFLPWTQWRHVRTSYYDLKGWYYWTEPKKWDWETLQLMRDGCPSAVFEFIDYDGEELTAKTRIEEREWRFGEGYFKWLSFFRKPMIRRSLDIEFSGEVGRKKGSWKGGLIGTSIDMKPDELHEEAFRRYCEQNQLSYIGPLE